MLYNNFFLVKNLFYTPIIPYYIAFKFQTLHITNFKLTFTKSTKLMNVNCQ